MFISRNKIDNNNNNNRNDDSIILLYIYIYYINTYGWKNNDFDVQHTVSVVFSKRCPSRHHVIVAAGLDPALWHSRSYRRPADNG